MNSGTGPDDSHLDEWAALLDASLPESARDGSTDGVERASGAAAAERQ
jgi:hypothetical protein